MNQLFSMIENLGFPIVLSMYLLVRFEKKIDTLSNSLVKLSGSINDFIKHNEIK